MEVDVAARYLRRVRHKGDVICCIPMSDYAKIGRAEQTVFILNLCVQTGVLVFIVGL